MYATSSPARLPAGRSSLLGALRGALAAMGDPRDSAEIAGLSALAFRLQVDAEASLASVSSFPWVEELPPMLSRLGYASTVYIAERGDPRFERIRRDALEHVGRAAAAGRPSIAFGVHLPEFGLLVGRDPLAGTLAISGVLDGRGGPDVIAETELGRGDVPVLFVLVPGEREPVDEGAAVRAALTQAIRIGRGAIACYGGLRAGLAAYDAWRTALDSGRIDPAGHAYLAQVTAELRAFAPVFLARAAGRLFSAAGEALEAARRSYARASEALLALAGECPFPLPDGFVLATSARRRQLSFLSDAAAAEREALEALERALDADRRVAGKRQIEIRDAAPSDADRLFRCIIDVPLSGLERESAELRAEAAERWRAKLALLTDGTVAGHVYYAELVSSGAAVELAPEDDGRYLYVYCTWVARERRGAGVGRRLFDALAAEGRAWDAAGLLVEATSQPSFLHHAAYEALGFVEVDRAEDDRRLLYLPLCRHKTSARLSRGVPRVPSGPLPLVVAHGRPCPVLLRATRNLVDAARACAARGVPLALEERHAPPHGVEVGGRRLPLAYIPREAAEVALAEAANKWDPGTLPPTL